MSLEVLVSAVDKEKKYFDKMNITSNCTVINQCRKNDFFRYKNFNIYCYNERGTSNSRNRGLEHITGDIILLCDDDFIYNDGYENIIINEFKNNKNADIIMFNINNPYRNTRYHKRIKRLHIYNSLRYSSCNIAFRSKSIFNKNIRFNTLFGGNAIYNHGEDTLFIVDALKSGLKVYSSVHNIGTVYHKQSSWFSGYNKKYFFDKGALFSAINYKFRRILIVQYLIRHKEVLKNYSFLNAYRLMIDGSNDYGERVRINN